MNKHREEKEKGVRFLMQPSKCGYSAELIYKPPTEEIKKHPEYQRAEEIAKDEWKNKYLDDQLKEVTEWLKINQDRAKEEKQGNIHGPEENPTEAICDGFPKNYRSPNKKLMDDIRNLEYEYNKRWAKFHE